MLFEAELARHLKGSKRAGQVVVAQNGITRGVCRVQVPEELATSWVVTLAHTGMSPASAFQNQDPGDSFAIIDWGSWGINQQVWVDWRLGCVIPITGSFVEVKLRVNNLPGDEGSIAPTTFAASIIPGSHASHPVYKSVDYGNVLDGANVTLPIPPYSVAVTHLFQNTTGQADNRNLRFTAEGGVDLLGTIQYTSAGSRNLPSYPNEVIIPPRATGVRFTAAGTGDFSSLVLIYRLAL